MAQRTGKGSSYFLTALTITDRLLGPVSKVVPGSQRMGMVGTEDPLLSGQQRGVLVARSGRIPRRPVQRASSWRAMVSGNSARRRHPPSRRRQSVGTCPGPLGSCATGEVGRDLLHTAAGQVEGQPGRAAGAPRTPATPQAGPGRPGSRLGARPRRPASTDRPT